MGKNKNERTRPILALYPNARGFGFAVMDTALSVVETQIITIRPLYNSKNIEKIQQLIEYFEPIVVVLENHDHPSSRKAQRIKELIDAILKYAKEKGIEVQSFSRSDIRFVFSNFNAHSKYEISKVIAENIPELKRRLMPQRKAYESEKYTAGVFDAVSLGVTYFYTSG